jgi:hypothetical protein
MAQVVEHLPISMRPSVQTSLPPKTESHEYMYFEDTTLFFETGSHYCSPGWPQIHNSTSASKRWD